MDDLHLKLGNSDASGSNTGILDECCGYHREICGDDGHCDLHGMQINSDDYWDILTQCCGNYIEKCTDDMDCDLHAIQIYGCSLPQCSSDEMCETHKKQEEEYLKKLKKFRRKSNESSS